MKSLEEATRYCIEDENQILDIELIEKPEPIQNEPQSEIVSSPSPIFVKQLGNRLEVGSSSFVNARIDILTIQGQFITSIYTGTLDSQEVHTISLEESGLSKGIYLYRLISNGEQTGSGKILLNE